MSGWIAIHRSLVDNPFWKAEKFTYGQAWVDLILTANFVDGSFIKSGQVVKVKRGQCAMSYASYQKRWGWSKGRVRRFFSNLERERMVSIRASHLTTIVTICNYDKFQDLKKSDEPAKRPPNGSPGNTPNGSPGGSRYNKENNNKQGEQEKNTPDKPGLRDELTEQVSGIFDYWKKTMGKDGKSKLTKKRESKIRARLKDGFSAREICEAIKGCAKSSYHMGQNDTGAIYDDLELICRDDSKVKMFQGIANKKVQPYSQATASTIETLNDMEFN